jgi:hypothetical protein
MARGGVNASVCDLGNLQLSRAELQLATSPFIAAAHASHEKAEQGRMALAKFRSDAVKDIGPTLPLPTTSAEAGIACLPGARDVDITQCVPPGQHLQTAAFSGKYATGNLRKKLREEWTKLHSLISPDTCQSLGKVPPIRMSTCFAAGFCLHNVQGKILNACVHQLQRALKQTLEKGSVLRGYYEKNALVLRIAEAAPGISHWFHVGYGNLSELHFQILRLVREDGTARSRVAAARSMCALRALVDDSVGCSTANFWEAFRKINLQLPLEIEYYRLAFSDDIVDVFRPGEIWVTKCEVDSERLWEGRVPTSKRSQGVVQHAAVEGQGAIMRSDEAELEYLVDAGASGQDVDMELEQHLSPALLEAWHQLESGWDSASSDSEDGDGAGAAGSREARQESRAEEAELDLLMQIAADEGLASAAPSGAASGSAGDGAAGPIVAAEPAKHRGWAGRNTAKNAHPTVNFGNGYLRLRAAANYIDAHCNKCGQKKDRTTRHSDDHWRKAQGRPMGFLLYWLSWDCGGDGSAHRDIHKRWAVEPMQRYEQRLALREQAVKSEDAVLTACFKEEREPRGDETRGEPHTIA